MAEKRINWKFADLFVSVARNPEGKGYRTDGRLRRGLLCRVLGRHATFSNPITARYLKEIRAAFSNTESGASAGERIGRRLFDSIFCGDIALLRGIAEQKLGVGQGLRLRFRSGMAETTEWPIELLHDSKGFLALQEKSPIVRYLGSTRTVRAVRIAGPLRILVVVSMPSLYDPLNVEEEWKGIQDGLAPLRDQGRVDVVRLDNPTLAVLGAILKKGKFHVLHFIGHGSRTPNGGGVLYLNGDPGAVAVPGKVLAEALKGHSTLRLVVLNACDGVAGGRSDRLSGVAANLVCQKIPAVVAMQAKIPDDSAVQFASVFYREVASGTPIDLAVTEARQALYLARHGKDLDWAIPVLFLGASSGKIFVFRQSSTWVWAPLLILALLVTLWVWTPWKKRCPSPKSVDIDMVWIPAGSLLMGAGKKGEPQTEVPIPRPFCMSATEVSQKQWETVMGANTAKDMEPRGDDLPMGGVTYDETQEFFRAMNLREGVKKVYRLPTSAEWEYAAGGPGGGAGSNCKDGDEYAGLAPVETFKTNDWGLYDMLGNVWEWVDQPGSLGLLGDQNGPLKAGGAFDSDEKNCVATARSPRGRDRNNKNTGFRIVRDIP